MFSRTAPPSRAGSFVLAIALTTGLLAVPAALGASSAPETYKKTVAADVVFEYGNEPGDPGHCSAAVFVQWKDIKDTLAATARYTRRGKEESKSFEPPWDDTYDWVKTYTAPPGYHRGNLSVSWIDGAQPNDCSSMSAEQREAYASTALVDLTIKRQPPPVITLTRPRVTLSGRQAVVIGTVECPKDGDCTSAGPGHLVVRFRKGNKRGMVRIHVRTSPTIAGGNTRNVTLRSDRDIPAIAVGVVRQLTVKIQATNGETKVTKVLKPRVTFRRS